MAAASPKRAIRSRLPSRGVCRPSMVSKHTSAAVLMEHYTEVRELGKGSYGRVALVRERITGNERVCKTVKIAGMSQDVLALMKKEIQLLSMLDHPGIVKLYEYAEDDEKQELLLILEYLPGGSCDEIIKDTKAPTSEAAVALMIYQLLVSLEYCHNQGIVHRDVKPENMMLTRKASAEGKWDCKLIDFGLADQPKPGKDMLVGTTAYVAPEMIRFEPHTSKVDIWSVGVTAFELLVGQLPFGKPTKEDSALGLKQPVFQRISEYKGLSDLEAALQSAPWWKHRSADARSFIAQMMHPDPLQRPTASEALEHPWLETYAPDVNPITNEITHSLAAFTEAPPVARSCLHIVAGRLGVPDIETLGGIFLSADTDCDGLISAEDLEEALQDVEGSSWWNPAAEVDVDSLLAAADFDHKGGIGYTAFIAACIYARHGSDEELTRRAFHAMDSDRDGLVHTNDVRDLFRERDSDLLTSLPQTRPFTMKEWCACVEAYNRKEKPVKRSHRRVKSAC